MAAIQPECSDAFDSQVETPRTKQGIWPNRERGRAPTYSESWEAHGPRDSIGDLLRIDDLVNTAGMGLSAFTNWSVSGSKYCPYIGSPIGSYYGAGISPEPINIAGTCKWGTDDDQDGISNNR